MGSLPESARRTAGSGGGGGPSRGPAVRGEGGTSAYELEAFKLEAGMLAHRRDAPAPAKQPGKGADGFAGATRAHVEPVPRGPSLSISRQEALGEGGGLASCPETPHRVVHAEFGFDRADGAGRCAAEALV